MSRAMLVSGSRASMAKLTAGLGGQLAAVKVGKQWLIRKDTLDVMLQPSTPQG
jgi:hypothetical protein